MMDAWHLSPGISPQRLERIYQALAGRFSRPRRTEHPQHVSIPEILDVDQEYHQNIHTDHLPRITPRRFNPRRENWIPVLHTTRGSAHYTALFANTDRAHALGMGRDWVVVYRDDPAATGHWTIMTIHHGPFKGRRIVRGHVAE